jgi:hypothetical protein
MLDPTHSAARRRRARAAKQRAYRARQKQDLAVYSATISFAVLDALVEWGWLREDEADDRRQVGRAITALLQDAASKNKA